MNDYKRIVSYLYYYGNREKKNNVGYVRMERKSGICKVTIHMRSINSNDKKLGVYFFYRRKEQLVGISLGTMVIRKGVGEFRKVLEEEMTKNLQVTLEELGGVIIYENNEHFFATQWDDEFIDIMNFYIADTKQEHKWEYEEEKEELKAADWMGVEMQEIEEGGEANKENRVEGTEEKEDKENRENGKREKEDREDRGDGKGEKEDREDREDGKGEKEDREDREDGTEKKEDKENRENGKGENADKEGREEKEGRKERGEGKFEDRDKGKEVERKEKKEDKEYGETANGKISEYTNVQTENGGSRGNEHINMPEELWKEDMKEKRQVSIQMGKEVATSQQHENMENTYANIQKQNGTEKAYANIQKQNGMEKAYANIQKQNGMEKAYANIQKQNGNENAYSNMQKQEYMDKKLESRWRQQVRNQKRRLEQSMELAEKLFEKFPKIELCNEESFKKCVKIEPQDIGNFPMETWALANNSFMLHGYYQYRYLIFALHFQEGQWEYVIGVPGIYEPKERFMAEMFGFGKFCPTSRKEKETGTFGYWYQVIHL